MNKTEMYWNNRL